jgi:hypothetical protein
LRGVFPGALTCRAVGLLRLRSRLGHECLYRVELECAGWRQLPQLVVYADGFAGRGLMHWPRCLPRSSSSWRSPGAPPWRLDRDRRRTRPISNAILATPAECTNRRAGQRAPARSQGRPRSTLFPLVLGSPRVSGSTGLSQIDRYPTVPRVRFCAGGAQ